MADKNFTNVRMEVRRFEKLLEGEDGEAMWEDRHGRLRKYLFGQWNGRWARVSLS